MMMFQRTARFLIRSVSRTGQKKRWVEPLSVERFVPRRTQSTTTAQTATKMAPASKLEQILSDARSILHDDDVYDSEYDLQRLLNDELMIITQILEKMVGTNISLSEIERICRSGSTSQHFVRGMVVLLVSKAACSDHRFAETLPSQRDIAKTQWTLAKIVEMVHMAITIHREILNVETDERNEEELNLRNKISVLYGDFLWAKAWKELADMADIEVIDMMVSVLVNTSEGQFLSEMETTNIDGKLNLDYWYKKNYLLAACLPAFGCKSTLKLVGIDPELQDHAYEFGLSFGFFNKAYQEIKWFGDDDNAIINGNGSSSIDLCSLPVIMHTMETGHSLPPTLVRFNGKTRKLEFDYQDLYEMVRDGPGLLRSRRIMNKYRQRALDKLNYFPDSPAKSYLKNIFQAMNV